jgi:hypothetical protein
MPDHRKLEINVNLSQTLRPNLICSQRHLKTLKISEALKAERALRKEFAIYNFRGWVWGNASVSKSAASYKFLPTAPKIRFFFSHNFRLQ